MLFQLWTTILSWWQTTVSFVAVVSVYELNSQQFQMQGLVVELPPKKTIEMLLVDAMNVVDQVTKCKKGEIIYRAKKSTIDY